MIHDFSQGRLLRPMIRFTIPLILANYLQLTYNAVDTIIVGRFLGPQALAAVGTSNPLMTLLIMLLRGTALGAGVLISTLYGARQYDKLHRQISTAMISGTVFALVLSTLVALFASPLLGILQVDPSIRPMAVSYLRIIAGGMVFTFLYNGLSSTLQALGDGRTPLLFLGISAALNISGDLVLIVVFRLGIRGAAIATVLSEAVSFLLCALYIRLRVPALNLGRKWLTFDPAMLKRTVQYGSVSALQQAAVQLGILSVQGIVNSLGMTSTAAFAAANRIDDFALIPTRSISNATTAVIAQNFGRRHAGRIRKAFRTGLLMEILYGIAVGFLLWLAAGPAMRLFTTDSEVIREGLVYLKLICLMYVMPAMTNALQGFFRGTGDLKITLFSTIVNMGTRLAATLLLVSFLPPSISAVPWGCFAGWAAMILWEVPFAVVRLKKLGSDDSKG